MKPSQSVDWLYREMSVCPSSLVQKTALIINIGERGNQDRQWAIQKEESDLIVSIPGLRCTAQTRKSSRAALVLLSVVSQSQSFIPSCSTRRWQLGKNSSSQKKKTHINLFHPFYFLQSIIHPSMIIIFFIVTRKVATVPFCCSFLV